jgi:beta-mannosidase
MNMLRVHAHVDHPAFYEAADLAGILLWQDFPLQWLYHREVLPEAQRQAFWMIELLGNHPAVAIWCMHNEALYTADTADERIITLLRIYFSVFVWNWNRDVLDTKLAQVAETADGIRPVVRSSGEYAVPLIRPGTDTHFYFGWYLKVYGMLRSWDAVIRRFPRNIRFVTEFGAQSFPNLESCVKFMDADIAKIDWQHLAERHHFQPDMLGHWLDWRAAQSLEELIRITQDYQITINRYYIDRLRYHKYRPTGGMLPFMFNDSNPAIQWSIVDYWRVPKRSYDAMRLALSPQYVFALLDRDQYPAGQPVELPIYIVNDAQQNLPAQVVARLYDDAGAELARVERALTFPADCMALELDRLRLTPERPGAYRLLLSWHVAEGESVEHGYDIIVGESPR